jgi:hypothetical protein
MPDTVVENPILNSPFREPARHWRFGDTGITNEVVESRRLSSYFMPIPASKVLSGTSACAGGDPARTLGALDDDVPPQRPAALSAQPG